MDKSIFASKTFWFNALSLAATGAGFLPPQYAAVALPVANVLLRLVTAVPVTYPGK